MLSFRVMSYRSLCFLVLSILAVGMCTVSALPSELDKTVFAKTIVPDPRWSCGMPEGIPCPEEGRLLFDVSLVLGPVYAVGETPYGERTVFVVKDGKLQGSGIQATVLSGGLDFQLTLSNGLIEIEQLLVLKMSAGHTVFMRNAGVGQNVHEVRVVMDFEAPRESEYTWLNEGHYVARRIIDPEAMTMTLAVYDVANVNSTHTVRIEKPTDRPPQPWDYRKADPSEKRGERIISEWVELGTWMSVGAGKRGVRHIIPITGGTLTGDIKGRIPAGGADYQLQSDTFTLDARYLWQTGDGEIIIVRNAGISGALVPVFEARIDGAGSWLNEGTYLSSDPKMEDGAVSLIMYRSSM